MAAISEGVVVVNGISELSFVGVAAVETSGGVVIAASAKGELDVACCFLGEGGGDEIGILVVKDELSKVGGVGVGIALLGALRSRDKAINFESAF